MELKRVKVRRLESDSPSHIHKQLEGDLSYHDKSTKRFNFTWTQHLYFTIDDEPKGGEWCYHVASHTITKYPKGGFPKGHAFKIIATTDPKLKLEDYGVKEGHWYVASPTQAFIKKYCKVGGIDEVLVEFEDVMSETIHFDGIADFKPMVIGTKIKVDSRNTITIHPFKNSWNREEVEELCRKALNHEGYNTEFGRRIDNDNWIENNIKKY